MTLKCRGIRGATTAGANTQEAILDATQELFQEMVVANGFEGDDVAAVFLTTTADLNAEFPAVALRQMGWNQLALFSGQEIPVPDGQPMCIRAMVLVNTEKSQAELKHIYLRDAKNLRSRGGRQGVD
jgi:chorismate mutase